MKASGLLKIYACSPTMKMFDVKKEDLIPEADEIAGAAAFLDLASDADVTLLVWPFLSDVKKQKTAAKLPPFLKPE
jgi:hypothetical protein